MVVDGLGLTKEQKPHLSQPDLDAIKEMVERKAAAFWIEGTPRPRFVTSSMTLYRPARLVGYHRIISKVSRLNGWIRSWMKKFNEASASEATAHGVPLLSRRKSLQSIGDSANAELLSIIGE